MIVAGDEQEPGADEPIWLPVTLRCGACGALSDGVAKATIARAKGPTHHVCGGCGRQRMRVHDLDAGGARTLAEAEAHWKPN